LVPTGSGGDDFVGIGGPGEGLWLLVVIEDEAIDGGLPPYGRIVAKIKQTVWKLGCQAEQSNFRAILARFERSEASQS
jgi:hypothetical protein